MVSYSNALKRPFSDIGKLLLAIVFALIPIVNIIYYGYLLEIAKTAMKKKFDMPEWKNFGTLFVRGLLSICIGFIYAIPILLLAGFVVIAGILLKANAFWIGIMVLTGVALVFYWVFISAVILRYAETYKFSKAFDVRYIIKKVFTGKYIGALILSTFIVIIIGGGLNIAVSVITKEHSIISYVLTSAIGTYIGLFWYTVIAQAYARA